jgi:hypothetical protein
MAEMRRTILSAGIAAALVASPALVIPTQAKADPSIRSDGTYDVAQNWRRHNDDWWMRHGHRPGWGAGPRHAGPPAAAWNGRGPAPAWRGARYYPHGFYREGRYWGPGNYDNTGALIVGSVLGLAAGAAIANSANQPRYVYGGDSYNSYCAQRFRTFDPATGTYTGYDGLQHRCVVPVD